jgi:glycerophosphoryl diester phosphodiesterase
MNPQNSKPMRSLALVWASCLLALSACGGTGDPAPETGEVASSLNTGYWANVTKAFPRTPTGHVVGIARHNSYVTSESTSSANLTKTNESLQVGINANADLIELDVKEEGGRVYVHHDDNGSTNGALLANVLDYASLKADDSVLYIEIKETSTYSSIARQMLDMLRARRTWYARDGRPVVFRTFYSRRAGLSAIQALLPEYPDLSPYIRFHVFLQDSQTADMLAFHGLIQDAKTQGWQGVEFPYDSTNLLSKIAYAKSLGLGVALWTIPVSMGEVYLSNLREEVDAFVCDYDVAKARAVVSDANQLLYMSVWNQPASGTSIRYYRTGATAYTAPVNVAGAPTTMTDGAGEDRYGTSLVFSAPSAQSLSFYDADTAAGQGYFVSAYINLDDLLTSCPGGASSCTMALLNKAEAGGFGLELYRSSLGSRVLRFGVHVGGGYQYATFPLDGLNGTNGYLISGAYDGSGAVRLWVDNSALGTTPTAALTGGVLNTDVPVMGGADPQASGAPRFFLSAKVQMLQVLRWAGH